MHASSSIRIGERDISLGKRIEQTHVSNYNVRLYVKNIIEAVYRGVHGTLYFNPSPCYREDKKRTKKRKN